jgi:polyferredoxin
LPKKWGFVRYLVFIASAGTVFILVLLFHYNEKSVAGLVDFTGKLKLDNIYQNLFLIPEFWWFIAGNIIYYASGILLAFVLKDNRAFCKYICPITAFLKTGDHMSLLRIKGSLECNGCGVCEFNCPMDIQISEYVRSDKRVTSTECIFCQTCTNSCPKGILKSSFGLDIGMKEMLRYRK